MNLPRVVMTRESGPRRVLSEEFSCGLPMSLHICCEMTVTSAPVSSWRLTDFPSRVSSIDHCAPSVPSCTVPRKASLRPSGLVCTYCTRAADLQTALKCPRLWQKLQILSFAGHTAGSWPGHLPHLLQESLARC